MGLGDQQIDYPHIEIIKYPIMVDEKEYRNSEKTNAEWPFEKYRNEKVVTKITSLVKG